MEHPKQKEVALLIKHKQPVLLIGEAGSGKTTIIMNIAKNDGIPYSFIGGTRQTTLSHIIGFMNINGIYVPSTFRKAYEEGHYFNIDEIDAMDANVLLVFNSLENNIMYFPDGYNKPPHKNFRFTATANPQNEHYTGRSKLDAATLDRFDIVDIDRDQDLEASLVDQETLQHINILRQAIKKTNSDIVISMRDSLRFQNRKNLKILKGFIHRLSGKSDLIYNMYLETISKLPKHTNQSECKTFKDLVDLLKSQ